MSKPGIITRAYQLAQECSSVEAIKARLQRENYMDVSSHLQGPALRRELNTIIKQVKTQSES